MVPIKGAIKWSLLALAALVALAGQLNRDVRGHPAAAQASQCWKATITEQITDVALNGSVLRVSVWGKSYLPVEVRSRGAFRTVGYTDTKPEYGPFVAEFAPLSMGIYYIEPRGLGTVFEIWLDGKNYTRVDFTQQPCPPTPTPTRRPPTATPHYRVWPTSPPATAAPQPPAPTQPPSPQQLWYGRIVRHEKHPSGVLWATIAVRVIGRPAGQAVEIRSGGWGALQKTGTKPEHGPDACEFGALQAGTYRIIPWDLGTHLDVRVEPGDFVLIDFYPTSQAESRWVGSVLENTSGEQPTEHVSSAIAVIVTGRPWHEVEIWSDGWSTTAKTGYKLEYGPDACEFGALRAGTYTITPKGLDVSVQVMVDGWGWALVRFDEITAPGLQPTRPPIQPTSTPGAGKRPTQTATVGPPTIPKPSPTPVGPRWQGWVVSNTSGQRPGRTGVSSVIVVRVLNWIGVPVTITGGGSWSTTCITGTKPEYGPDACEFGGLWASTYLLQPEGADIQVPVEMDGLGMAIVEFAAPPTR
jgi:hypothetical protein